jgi:hypothetical protein
MVFCYQGSPLVKNLVRVKDQFKVKSKIKDDLLKGWDGAVKKYLLEVCVQYKLSEI